MRITRVLPPLLLAAALAACGASRSDDDLPRADGVPPAADSATRPVALAPPADSATQARSAAAGSGCLTYEETVTIRGRLERRMFYGPPNYGENPESDDPEPGFYLVPDAPVCTRPGTDPGDDRKQDVRLVQMVLDSAGYARAGPFLDTRVRATGRLFGQHTGHHHAELLLMADSIVPADGRR